MPSQPIPQQRRCVDVVDLACFGTARLITEKTAQVGGQHAITQGQIVQQCQGALLVQIRHLDMVGAHAQVLVDLIITTAVSQVRGFSRALESAIGRRDSHGLVVGGVTFIDRVDISGVEGQTVNFFGADGGPAKGLGQKPRRAGKGKRQKNRHITGLERGLAKTQLAGEGQSRVLIRSLFVTIDRQQFGAAAVRRRVQLAPQQTTHIQPETDRALGKARLHVGNEALGPFPRCGLDAIVLVITVHVVVAQGQGGVTVFDKSLGPNRGTEQAQGNARKREQAQGALVERMHIECPFIVVFDRTRTLSWRFLGQRMETSQSNVNHK